MEVKSGIKRGRERKVEKGELEKRRYDEREVVKGIQKRRRKRRRKRRKMVKEMRRRQTTVNLKED